MNGTGKNSVCRGRNATDKENIMKRTDYLHRIPLSLVIPMQYFADPAGTGGDTGANDPDAGNGNTGDDKPLSFTDLLKSNKDYQSEHDKIVAKSLETAKKKWEADAKARADEAARLAAMSAEEKANAEREAAEKELAKREADVTRRELHAEAVSQLTEKGFPAGLAEILDYTSAETCKASIETVSKAFSAEVEKGVANRLKGTPPKKGTGNSTETDPFLAGLGVK